MVDYLKLDGKIALVTGAASGIGAACARSLAQAGAKVLATDIDAQAVATFAEQCKAEGLTVESLQHDVAEEEHWAAASSAILEHFGGWDILVNNAGIYRGDLLIRNDLKQIQKLNQVNIESIFLGMRSAVEIMKPDGRAGNGGSIINLSSVAGLVGVPGHSAYGATKGAVRSYSRHAAVEFAALEYGVRVNSLHPGVIDTDMGDQVYQDFVDVGMAEDADAGKELVLSLTPMKRLGEVEDMANAVLFLSSDASSYMTGAELVVDGGLTAT